MQAILQTNLFWVNSVKYQFRKVSAIKTQAKKNKYYASKPEYYTKLTQIKKKIDFKNGDLTFPINIPLKFRYIFKPQKHMIKPVLAEDYLKFDVMSGNEILLYLEQASQLRNSELLDSLVELKRRNDKQQLKLNEHPWVLKAFEIAFKKQVGFTKEQFFKFLELIKDYEIETDWQVLEEKTRANLPNIKAKHFGKIYELFLEKDGMRSSEEFRQELALILPAHLKKMNPHAIMVCFTLTYKNNLMTEYLFENHLHQIFWKRLNWFISQRVFAEMLQLFREANYENDEFLWPDLYKTLDEQLEKIPHDYCRTIRDELIRVQQAFPSHENYDISQIIRKLSSRVTWEETLGGESRKLSLVEMVKNDLLFYKEQEKLKRKQ